MNKVFYVLFILLGLISGCSNEKNQSEGNENGPSLEMIEVAIQIPETINPGEETKITAQVSQGKDKVDDANEVKFEVWKVGQEQHEMLISQNEGNGIYSAKKTFNENGQYIVIAHVTARSMHSMPQKEFTVGNSEQKDGQDVNNNEATETHEETHEHDHEHHTSNLEISFNQKDSLSINQEVTLQTTILEKSKPLLGAIVRFEIIPEDGSKTLWLETKEKGKGSYSAITTFNHSGNYHIQIHVNKDEIHEHKIIMLLAK